MTLNNVERRDSLILRLSAKFDSLQDYVTVVEMSVKYCLPVPVFHFWPKLTHPAAWSLCVSILLVWVMNCEKIAIDFSKAFEFPQSEIH